MKQRDISTAEAFALRKDGAKMSFPYGVRPPNGDLGMSRKTRKSLDIDSFDAFNCYAMSQESLFADHPRIVSHMISYLSSDDEAKELFIKAAKDGIDMTSEGVVLTPNDIQQILRSI